MPSSERISKPLRIFSCLFLLVAGALVAGCASFNLFQEPAPGDVNIDEAELRAALNKAYWPGFHPLDKPVAFIDENGITFLNGPCVGLSKTQCLERVPGQRLPVPGKGFLMENPALGILYNLYAHRDPARLAALIAHEQFHLFQDARIDMPAMTGEGFSPNRIPTRKEIGAFLRELEALAAVDVATPSSLACYAALAAERARLVPSGWNELLDHAQRIEGSAEFVGLMYGSRGDAGKVDRYLRELLQSSELLEGPDWHFTLRTLSYILGAKKYLLYFQANRLDEVRGLQAVPDVAALLEQEHSCSASERQEYEPDPGKVADIRESIKENREALVEEFLAAGQFEVTAMPGGRLGFHSEGWIRLENGFLILGDPTVEFAEGKSIRTIRSEFPMLILRCGEDGIERLVTVAASGETATLEATPRASTDQELAQFAGRACAVPVPENNGRINVE